MHEPTSLDAAASLGLALDLADRATYDRAVQRCRDVRVALPTFAQLADPATLPAGTVCLLGKARLQATDLAAMTRVTVSRNVARDTGFSSATIVIDSVFTI